MMSEPGSSPPERRFKLSPRIIVGAVIGILALVFVLQNTGHIRVHVLFASIDNPAWVWLVILFAAGYVVGSIFPWFHRRTKRAHGPSASSE
jgi:uncharacterized integral membrane protein